MNESSIFCAAKADQTVISASATSMLASLMRERPVNGITPPTVSQRTLWMGKLRLKSNVEMAASTISFQVRST